MTRTCRLVCLALCLAGAAWLPGCGASPSAAQIEQADDRADSDATAAARAFAAMPAVADQAVAYWTRRYGAPPKAVAEQLRASARKGFDPALLAARVPPPGDADAAVDRALAKYQAAFEPLVATFSTADTATLRHSAEAEDPRLSARADRATIDALADVMPAPERAGERAETLRRMLAALDAVHGGLPDDLRAADAAKLADAVSEIIANVRRPRLTFSDGLPTAGLEIEAARGASRRALVELSPADIAALHGYYGNPAGRNHRQLLVTALAEADYQAGRTMLLDFFTAVRALPPESFR